VGGVVADNNALLIPGDAPPGEYTLEAGMYELATLERLPVVDDAGRKVGDHVILGTVEVLSRRGEGY